MDKSGGTLPTTKELLEEYYKALSGKEDWSRLLAKDFSLSGAVTQETRGRDAYVNNGFFKMVKGLRVRELMTSGDTGFALVSYELASPKGKNFSSEVAELWKAKGGELVSIAIYFDTAVFNRSMA